MQEININVFEKNARKEANLRIHPIYLFLTISKILYEIFLSKSIIKSVESRRLEDWISLLKPVGGDSAFPGPMDLYSPPRYPVLVFKREIAQRMKNMVASCMKVGAKAITEFMTESGRIEHEACHGILNNSVQMIEVSKQRSRFHLDSSWNLKQVTKRRNRFNTCTHHHIKYNSN